MIYIIFRAWDGNMELEKIDGNFAVSAVADAAKFYNVKTDGRFIVQGLLGFQKDREFTRIPKEELRKMPDGVKILKNYTSGGRVYFATDSSYIVVRYKGQRSLLPHATAILTNGFDIYEGKDFLGSVVPPLNFTDNYESRLEFGRKKMRSLVINFPLYGEVKEMELGLEAGAILERSDEQFFANALFYGSSITQGACSSRPGTSYVSAACRKLKIDFYNLGFSGSAKAEKSVAEYIAGIPTDVFVFDYDYNAPNAEYLMKTHEPFYFLYRKKNPNTPVLFISKPDYSTQKKDDRVRRDIIFQTYRRAKERGENVFLLDGKEFYPKARRGECSVDGCHPNDLGAYFIGKKLERMLSEILDINLKNL